MSVSTKDLKRSLGKKELFSVAIGQIIGAGIMALTGIAIAMTGRSVNISFILAALAVILLSIPVIFVSSSVRMRGGQYSQAAVLVGQRFAGIYIVIFIFANVSLAMYALSFADYFTALIPGLSSRLVAVVLMTLIFIVNFFGVVKATRFQLLMVIIMVASLAAFVGFGIIKIAPGYFEQPGFFVKGISGLLTAMALLTFATGGATVILNLSAEAKNPKKDIPVVIIISTLSVALLYAFMSTVAAGVLPIGEVANKPLTLVARTIFPEWLYVFFVIGGAMFALVTTLNAQVSWVTKPVMQACVDNWFPKSLATLHPKFNTPYKLLIIFYVIGMVPILTGWNIELIANSTLILNYVSMMVNAIGVFRLPKMFPDQWKTSPFHMKRVPFFALNLLGILVLFLQLALMARNMNKSALIGNVVILIFALVFGIARNKKVSMEISVEEK